MSFPLEAIKQTDTVIFSYIANKNVDVLWTNIDVNIHFNDEVYIRDEDFVALIYKRGKWYIQAVSSNHNKTFKINIKEENAYNTLYKLNTILKFKLKKYASINGIDSKRKQEIKTWFRSL